jgi:light-dependent protochlorophyllide reductase
MRRDTVLVTGGNSGIGFECAGELARRGWHVVIASRNRDASEEAIRRIARESGADAVSELGLDLGSAQSVRRFAKEIEERNVPLRALVCNAGVQVAGAQRLSADGYELTFAVNHLGHFLLTNLLLTRLLANAPARIVVVSSGVHDGNRTTGMPKPAVTDIRTLAATGGPHEGRFNGQVAYVNSKLSNLWFTYELERRLAGAGLSHDGQPVTVNAYDPGLVPGSGLAREYPAALRFVWDRILPGVASVLTAVYPAISTAEQSGRALARLVWDPALIHTSGKYFPSHTRWAEAPSSADSRDATRARELWEASVQMTHLTPAESPLAALVGSG